MWRGTFSTSYVQSSETLKQQLSNKMDVSSKESDTQTAKERWSELTGSIVENKASTSDIAFSEQCKASSKQSNWKLKSTEKDLLRLSTGKKCRSALAKYFCNLKTEMTGEDNAFLNTIIKNLFY